MLKRHSAFLLMFTAYAILLGHSIVPHHHHHDSAELNRHHDHDHEHNHDDAEKSGGLNHLFSHFLHASDEITFRDPLIFNTNFSTQLLSFVAVLPENLSFIFYTLPPLEYKPPAEEYIFKADFKLSFGLRAPPSFLA